MDDIKELAKWLEEEVEFLKDNQEFVGGWNDLGNGLAAVVLWEDGWGDDHRDDAIQATDKPDWALCAGIMLINKDDTPDGWFMPWDSKTGEIICETTGILPDEDYEKLAGFLLDDFNRVKDLEIKPNGEVIGFNADENKDNPQDIEKLPDEGKNPEEIKAKEDESCEDCHEECKKPLKEENEYHSSPYHDVIAEYFEYDSDFEFLDVVANIIARVDDFESEEDIWQSIDDELIYTYDQWKVLEHYCTPQEANWEVAFDSLSGDIFGVCSTIAESNRLKKNDEDEPEEGEDDD